MLLLYFVFGCFLCVIIAAVVNCGGRIKKHKYIFTNYKKIINEGIKVEEIKNFFFILNERSFDYIRNYFIFQGVAKCTNGLAFLFTVASLVLTASPEFETKFFSFREWGIIVSVISIIFVVINIYINPTKRGSQYLERWRDTDKDLIRLIVALGNYSTDEMEDIKNSELRKLAVECADDLTKGEFKITSDEE